jgi:NADH:ubiquinone oxidoreductase subunit F (NADH-binding)
VRPVVVVNAETFAQLAIGARSGSHRYGHTGLDTEPGTVMLTISGAVARPMVVEVPTGVPLRYVLRLAGAPPLPQGVLTGGYHGNWIDSVAVHEAVVPHESPAAVGGSLGAGTILPIGPEICPLGEALRVTNWLAVETAGRCGPCRLGLPAAAGGLSGVMNGGGPAALEALREVTQAVKGGARASTPTARRASSPRPCPPSLTTSPHMYSTAAADARGSACCRFPARLHRRRRSRFRAVRSSPWTGRSASATGSAPT